METTTVSDATLTALKTLGKIYSFCYDQFQQANIPLPPPERLYSNLSKIATVALSNAPPIFGQFFTTLSRLPIQANLFAIIAGLVALYVIYTLIMAFIRSIFRLVFGFIRFTFIVVVMVSVLLLLNQYYEIPLLQDFLGTALAQQQQQHRPYAHFQDQYL